jgi:hypothetical protein
MAMHILASEKWGVRRQQKKQKQKQRSWWNARGLYERPRATEKRAHRRCVLSDTDQGLCGHFFVVVSDIGCPSAASSVIDR